MAVLDAKKTYKNLLKKGFDDASSKSDDHKWLELFYDGKLVLHTKISHGEKDLGDFLIKQMSLQCKLDKTDFMDLANCPLSKKQYFEILEEKGYI
ncbi:hypothetical protein GCM10027035_33010 [Emticicia sediminis]